MKKRLATLVLAGLTLLAAGCGGQQSAEKTATAVKVPIKVGYTGSLCEAPLHIAIEKGFFEKEGLQVEAIKLAPGTNFEAITAGKIDASFSLMASLVQPLSNGLPVKITTGLHTGCDKLLVPENSPIKTAADLKGKRIGVPSMSSSPIIFTKRALAAQGIGVTEKNNEVEFIVFSGAELPLALSKGSIDAIAINDPVAAIAQKQYNLVTIADSAKDAPYKDQYCCVAYVSDKLANADPETAAKYTRAMQNAAAWIQANPDETAKIQVEKKYVAGDAELNASVLKTYNYIPSVSGAYDTFATTAQELANIGVLKSDVDIKKLHENSFIKLKDVPDSVTAKQ